MTEERSPLEQAVDLLVFAPLGLALAARDELPRLIERGRSQSSSQVALARMLGQMAAAKGQQEARRVVEQLWTRVAGDTGSRTAPGRKTPSSPGDPPRPPTPGPAPATATPAGGGRSPSSRRASARGGALPRPDPLAIPGYDALSAPQVVQRLSGLSPEELEAVAAYERATRHRQTILGRVAQLQSATGS